MAINRIRQRFAPAIDVLRRGGKLIRDSVRRVHPTSRAVERYARTIDKLADGIKLGTIPRTEISKRVASLFGQIRVEEEPVQIRATEHLIARLEHETCAIARVIVPGGFRERIWFVQQKRHVFLDTVTAIVEKKEVSTADAMMLRTFLRKDCQHTSPGIAEAPLTDKLTHVSNPLLLVISRIYLKSPEIVSMLDLIRNEEEATLLEAVMGEGGNLANIREKFAAEKDLQKKLWVLGILKGKLRGLIEHYAMAKELAALINEKETPPELIPLLVEIGEDAIRTRLPYMVEDGTPALGVAEKVRKIGREVADQAYKTLRAVREITARTRKPTFTVYILTTAAGLNAEKSRPLDALRTNNALRESTYQRIITVHADSLNPADLERVERTAEPEAKVSLQIIIIEQIFQRGMDHLRRSGFSQDADILHMAVAAKWIETGAIDRFSLPIEFKIPSGSPPTAEARERIVQLARAAQKYHWDIIFVDHSTVRTAEAAHPGDPMEFENGRAIARGLQIVRDTLGPAANISWLYQKNRWRADDLTLEAKRPNVIGLNLYHGRVYAQRIDGGFRKQEWLPIDDRKTLFFGRGVDPEGAAPAVAGGPVVGQAPAAPAAVQFDPREGFVIERERDGRYVYHRVIELYWSAFEIKIREFEQQMKAVQFQYRNILCVCNANHHRSRLAEYTLQDALYQQYGVKGRVGVSVQSAGLDVDNWRRDNPKKPEVSERVRKLLETSGYSLTPKPKRQISPEVVAASDLILVMTQREKEALLKRFPDAQGKVFLYKAFAGISGDDLDIPTPKQFDESTLRIFHEASGQVVDRLGRAA